MLGTLLSFSFVAVAARELSSNFTIFQVLFFRSLIGLLACALLLQLAGWGQVKTRVFGQHAARNLSHFVGQYGWFYGITLLPLAEVFAIEFTTPLWTAIFAVWLLNERFNRARLIAIILGMSGTLLILRPGLAIIDTATLAVLIGAIGYGMTNIYTKRMAGNETALCILFYMCLVQLPISIVPAINNWVTPSGFIEWSLVTSIALLTLFAHFCMAKAMQYADAMVVAPMDYLRLPLITVVGWLMYNEQVSWLLFAGAALMLAGNLVNIADSEHTEHAGDNRQ